MWTIVVGTRLRRFRSPKVCQCYNAKKRTVMKQRLPSIITRAIIITKYVLIVVWNILNLGLIEEFRFLLMGLKWLRKWVRSMWHDCTPTGNMGNMINILSIWFSHFTVTETHWWYNESLSLHFNEKKKILRWSVLTLLTHLLAIETASKLVDNGRKIQN